MAKIQINNPRQIINGGAKKYYFKVKGLGGPKGDKGDKGDTGSQGPQGPQGNAATVSVGSTTTLPVGYDATVTNSGSIYNAVLDFGIPQGPRGPQGAKGEKGDTGAQGETGPRGPQGERGTNATVSIGTTYTLNPGSQATVYNSGSDSNAVLNFGIPRGDVGPMPTIAQTTGQAIDQVMSQKATTDALNTKQATITNSNKLSADLVTDTTTTNKFVTAEDKTTWNAKQNALTAGDNIEITGDTISTTAIAPEVVAELPTTGAEGKLYLTPKNYTRSTATGNPITATVAEEAGKMESFQLDGDAFQKSYEGKNLCGIPDQTFTHLGVTVTIKDGEVTMNGTSTGTGSKRISPIKTTTLDGSYTTNLIYVSGTAGSGNFNLRKVSDNTVIQGTQASFFNSNQNVSYSVTNEDIQFGIYILATGTVFTNYKFKIQIVAGSTADYDFEPYVGGTPSPSPDYPQPIQTVTGEQTVEVVGKNLIDPDGLELGNIDASGNDSDSQKVVRSGYIRVAAGSYTLKVNNSDNNINLWRYAIYDNSKTFVSANTPQAKSATITIANNGYIRVSFYNAPWKDLTVQEIIGSQVQLELGSTATSYVPYSHQTLPLNLGSIELCKLGTYQDYIYKDGDDWKVHKEIGYEKKIVALAGVDGYSSVYGSATTSNGAFAIISPNWGSDYATTAGLAIASSVIGVYQSQNIDGNNTANSMADGTFCQRSGTNDRVYFRFASWARSKTVNEVNQMITDNGGVDLWYPLATPTDTTITDTDLIAQLEAIRTASLENGTNTITNSTPAPNLAGDMEVGYYGYNPTNRYDKWLWLDLNNNYEQIGS